MNKNIEIGLICCAMFIAGWITMWLGDLWDAYCKKYGNHVDLNYVEKYKISFHPPNEFHPEMWHIKTNHKQYEYKSINSIKEFCRQIRFEKFSRIF